MRYSPVVSAGIMAWAVVAASGPAAALEYKDIASHPPAAYRQVDTCVPSMGTVWADPSNQKAGPFLGYNQGQLIGVQYKWDKTDLQQKKSFENLSVQGAMIDHFHLLPPGERRRDTQHFDLSVFVVEHSAHSTICGRQVQMAVPDLMTVQFAKVKNRAPRGYEMTETCRDGVGASWSEQKEFGARSRRAAYSLPRFGYMENNLVVVEYEFDYHDLVDGKLDTYVFPVVKGMTVDHVDMIYSNGHEGALQPHYDLRFYAVGHDQDQAFCRTKSATSTGGGKASSEQTGSGSGHTGPSSDQTGSPHEPGRSLTQPQKVQPDKGK